MTEEQARVLKELTAAGYAVIVWTPEELKGADPQWVEECSISYANEYLLEWDEETEETEEE